ncbi:tyrosine recombinase XerC [Candidatus Latescibacterota bacterium]
MAAIKSVRVIKTKYGTYSLNYINHDGRRRRLTIGKNYEYAQQIALRFTNWLIEGKNPECEIERAKQTEKAKGITIREFYPTFMEQHGSLQSKKMQESYYYSFKNICRCPAISESIISSISKRHILEYMHLRIKNDGVTGATVNRDAVFVKGMLSRAIEWDYLDNNPLKGLKLFPEAEKREVNLTPVQAAFLLDELPIPVDQIVEFAIYSGFRKENILSLKIESIRFYDIRPDNLFSAEGEADIVVKGGRKEKFPLGTLAVNVLKKSIGNRTEGYVFLNPLTGNRYRSIHKTFDRAVRKVGLTVNGTKLRIHDLRHVFATWLHMAGVSLDILRPLLGHRSRTTTDRYVSIDRLAIGKVLNVMPSIGDENEYKKMASINE